MATHDSRYERLLLQYAAQRKQLPITWHSQYVPQPPAKPKPVEGKVALGEGCWQARAPHSD